MGRVKVALHTADPLSAVGLAGHLERRQEIELLSGDQRGRADVIVLAAEGFPPDVASSVRRCVAEIEAPVVLVAGELDDAELAEAVRCGVVAVLRRIGMTADRLACSVVDAASGRTPAPMAPSAPDAGVATAKVTAREAQVLRLMADGLDTMEIAARLSYSERTVKNVLYGFTARFNLRNRPHAVAYALRLGLI